MARALGRQRAGGSVDRPLWEPLTDHWKKLTPRERDRVRTLLVRSEGRPNRITQREQAKVKRMVTKLEAGQLATELVHRAQRSGLLDRLPRVRS